MHGSATSRTERPTFAHVAFSGVILDRLVHHAETVLIEGKSYRQKDRIKDQDT